MNNRQSRTPRPRTPVFSSTATAALLVGFLLASATPAQADVLVVTRLDDPSPDGCSVTDCSLREAVIAANADPDADTIKLSPGDYSLTIPGIREDASATGDLDLLAPVTIEGSGADTTAIRGAGSGDRIIHFPYFASGPITISGVTIRDGTTVWVDTQSESGAGIAMYPSKNGVRAFEQLTLRGVHLTSNESGRDGGGLWSAAVLTIVDSTISGNTAFGDGGGAWISSIVKLTNVTVSGNRASNSGGGIASLGSFTDGAPNDVRILNSTITDNSADLDFSPGGDGGGILSIPTTTLRNTIVAGNSDRKAAGQRYHPDCSGEFTAHAYNLVGNNAGCGGLGATDQFGTTEAPLKPGLSFLGGGTKHNPAPSGGPTPTHVLLPGSPAIDRGSGAPPGGSETACSATDQRGMPRPQESACDVGAYELGQCFGVAVNRIGTPGSDNMTGSGQFPEAYLLFSGNDTVTAGAGKDVVCGGEGDDVLSGGPGEDRLDGGLGSDTLIFPAAGPGGVVADLEGGTATGDGYGKDTLVGIENATGTPSTDWLRGNESPNVFEGLAGYDNLEGLGGDDHLLGGTGEDRLLGGPGDDDLAGDTGPDRLYGDSGVDLLDGGPGRDRLWGRDGPDHLLGGLAADALDGGRGPDGLRGGAGRDHLTGGPGSDSCIGGKGRDIRVGCETAFPFLK